MSDCISRQAAIKSLRESEAYDEDISNRADGVRDAIIDIMSLPTIDAVEVVRCKDCKYKNVYRFPPKYCERDYCEKHGKIVDVADFCCWAERRTDG